MNKQTSLAYDNLELLSELPHDKDVIRLMIDGNKINKIQPGFFDTMFHLKDLVHPVNFSFMRMMHYLDECEDRYERESLIELMDDALDLLFYLANHVSEGSKEEDITLSDFLHDIDHLLSNYRQEYTMISICSRWANAIDIKFNRCLDQVTETLSECHRYLYITPTGYSLALEEVEGDYSEDDSKEE